MWENPRGLDTPRPYGEGPEYSGQGRKIFANAQAEWSSKTIEFEGQRAILALQPPSVWCWSGKKKLTKGAETAHFDSNHLEDEGKRVLSK